MGNSIKDDTVQMCDVCSKKIIPSCCLRDRKSICQLKTSDDYENKWVWNFLMWVLLCFWCVTTLLTFSSDQLVDNTSRIGQMLVFGLAAVGTAVSLVNLWVCYQKLNLLPYQMVCTVHGIEKSTLPKKR